MNSIAKMSANRGIRFANFIVDFVIIMIITSILPVLLAAFNLFELLHLIILHYNLVFCFVAFFYYLLFESFTGRTIGKYITKTKVVTKEGLIPSFSIIVGRTLGRFIPFDALSYLGKEGWHDSWSDTRVIYV